MRYGNCWLYALPRWLRHPFSTCLITRKSRFTFWPHVFWCCEPDEIQFVERGEYFVIGLSLCGFAASIEGVPVSEYKPDEPQIGFWSFLMAIIFKGHVRNGKGEE